MLDRSQVYLDVAVSMKETVIHDTEFSSSTYKASIVPEKELTEGFGADLNFWGLVLKGVEVDLRRKNPIYDVFTATVKFAEDTISLTLTKTCSKITEVIMKKSRDFQEE